MVTAEQTTHAESVARADVSIEANGVTKFFGELAAVNDLTFTVKKGEVVGFLGPNGSGKTTTMRMLTSFYTPDVGGINIDGLDTKDHDLATRERIGYLPENNPVYADLLVNEYLDFVADLRGLTKTVRRENIAQTVEETGLQDVYTRPIGQLSKGYKQRVGLAQAIVHRPSILILDEPTEGLDPNQRLTIRDLIRSLGQERTVMLSTHVMQEVENTCERILLISRGKLVADSPVKDLLQRAQGIRTVHIEVEGAEVERALESMEGGGVEALGHLVVLGGVLKGQADFAADDVCFQQVAAGGSQLFSKGQQGWEDGDGGVAEAAEVVVIKGMAHGAVGQGGVGQGRLVAGGQDGGLGVAAQVVNVILDDVADGLDRAG